MSTDHNALAAAAEKHKIPQIIVGYLKLQQAKKDDFFMLLMDNKINGRLFYNTCAPGTKEIKYGNEDFLYEDFKNAVDQMLAPFKNLSLAEVKAESVKPTAISEKMREVITAFLENIETSHEWTKFWEAEIHIQTTAEQKKQLYNMIAGAAAYKALVSCVDQSNNIADPHIKRNIEALIVTCTSKYESPTLQENSEFVLKTKSQNAMGDFTVFKKAVPEVEQEIGNKPAKKKRRKKKVELHL